MGISLQTNQARNWNDYTAVRRPEPKKQIKVKVRQKGWITKGEKFLYSAIGVILVAASFYLVSYASINDSLNRDVQSLEETIVSQQKTNNVLMFEIKELSKPDRIIEIAKDNGLKINSEVKQAKPID